jgi:multidrug efflux pump subunit AcrB
VSISEPFIRRPVATTLLMAALAFVGIVSFPFLPVAPLPQVDFPTIQITTTWAGASAETMATSVAAPLEQQFGQIAGITQMTSTSSLGATTIVIQFDLNRNIDSASQDVQAAITVASKTLPQALTTPPAYKKVNPADTPVLLLSVHSDTTPLIEVDDYANLFLAQQLSQVNGVAQVSVFGDVTPSIRVQVDPAKLAASGLTLEEIRGQLVTSTTNAAKGVINGDKITFTIAANDQITDAEKFNDVVIAYKNGAPIRVRDVGQAVAEPVDRTVAAYQNNKDGVILAIFKQPGANVIDIVDSIKAELPQLTARIPPAVKVETILDRTVTIRASVDDVEFTLALTICLVVMVILLFLRNFWATLIPSVTVPLALAGSFAAMYLMNFSLDNLSLMALTIAVGFVVDDAIVVVENIYRHVEHGEAPFAAALKGSREIGFTVLSISCSLIAVFIPLLLMSGIIGRLFREFALTVTASIAVSALVSLTLAPMMCSRFMHRESGNHGRVYRFIESGFDAMISFYRRTLDIVLRHQPITLGVFFGTMALTVVMAYYIPKGFFPIQDTGMLQGFAEAAQETSPKEMMRLLHNVGEVLLRDPDIDGFGSFTGSTGAANSANTGRFFIVLKPHDQRSTSASRIIDRLRPQLAKLEGVNLFLQPTQDINVGARVARGSFQYTLQDTNIDELNEWSQKLLEKLRALPVLPVCEPNPSMSGSARMTSPTVCISRIISSGEVS